jgi:SAM-dependent methyltransferase
MERQLEAVLAAEASTYTIDDQRRMSRAKNYFAWQGQLVRREAGQRVIEVGCGVGNFTGMLLDREVVIAVDKEPACVEGLKLRYLDRPNLQTFTCDASDDDFLGLARFRADTCVCLNVLEHIEDDAGALQRMAAVLVPGGVVVLFLPAFAALYGTIDKNLGHHRRYTIASLRQLIQKTGLQLGKAHYLNALGSLGWWTNSHIFGRAEQSERQIEIFDRYLVPIISRIERLSPPPFGQSIFAVLQKP